MFDLVMFFREGGIAMWFLLVFGLAGLGVGLAYALTGGVWALYVGGALFASVILCGVGGTMMGRHATEAAVAMVSPADRAQILEAGYRESLRPVELMGALLVPMGALLAAGEARRQKRRASA